MSKLSSPALTPEQWEARDYRQAAREIDRWAQSEAGAAADDATEYVAKLGLSGSGSVIVMNRAHDRVLVPPPARAPLAALALAGQPCGFTSADVQAVLQAAERTEEAAAAAGLRDLGHRIQGLLPPAPTRYQDGAQAR
jgi:hypothetical protein